MQHFFTIPVNGAGIITDPSVADSMRTALSKSFDFTDFYVYSHGWWTDATRAMLDYNRFSIGFGEVVKRLAANSKTPELRSSLAIGIHWPSMVSEDQLSLANLTQPASYYSMEHRADQVGTNAVYALLRLIAEAQPSKPRINLLGHSFGCKVVCAALQEISNDPDACKLPDDTELNVVLMQAAFAAKDLAPSEAYGRVPGFKHLRVLVTRSDRDLALKNWFSIAENTLGFFGKKSPRVALGFAGPDANVVTAFGGSRTDVTIPAGFDDNLIARSKDRLIVADITALHASQHAKAEDFDKFSGQHSDIFHKEIYTAICQFLARGSA